MLCFGTQSLLQKGLVQLVRKVKMDKFEISADLKKKTKFFCGFKFSKYEMSVQKYFEVQIFCRHLQEFRV